MRSDGEITIRCHYTKTEMGLYMSVGEAVKHKQDIGRQAMQR